MAYSLTWDLDVFFKGGSSSEEYARFWSDTEKQIAEFSALIDGWQVKSEEKDMYTLEKALELHAKTFSAIRQAGGFISCLTAQNTADKQALALQGTFTKGTAAYQNVITKLDQKLVEMDEEFFQDLIKKEPFNELAYILNESRTQAKEMLPVAEESLINQLSVDGYHGWGQMYDTIVAGLKIKFRGEELSAGQAANKFSDLDPAVRREIFAAWEEAWSSQSELFAKTLNHLSGFRLSVYNERGWDDVLAEPLEINRMERKTLDTMWSVISDNKGPLVRFLKRKAELLDTDSLSWADLDAPIDTGSDTGAMGYQEGAEFITRQFGKFGSQLASFTEKAFQDSWIEAEDRPNKRPGGFCTGFPVSGQSRIFMTYSGTPSNLSTLAHELGHAFHSYALKDTHPLNRSYAMNVAETASTFAEMIVADASLKEAGSEAARLALLEDKIQRSVALLMNIHARFLFETRFYEERKRGMVSASRLNELMEEAQREAYGDALSEYHPSFWSSKLHFYITGVPFYNFPYTFGYLFSLGIYAKAAAEGEGFEEKYMALLRDTGSMRVEDLARKHLGADLTERDFWEQAVGACMKDVEEFLELTNPLVQQA